MKIIKRKGMLVLEHNKSLLGWLNPSSKSPAIELELISGTVIEDQGKTTETHISGGGGSTGEYGYIEPVQSNNVTTHTFWIKEESGIETLISIERKTLAIRKGHKISLLKNKERWIYLVNHTSKDISSLCNLDHLRKQTGNLSFFLGIAGGLIGMEIGGAWYAGVAGFLLTQTAAFLIIDRNEIRKVRKNLPAVLKEFAQEIDLEQKEAKAYS